jgi:hypothetical protein
MPIKKLSIYITFFLTQKIQLDKRNQPGYTRSLFIKSVSFS